MLGLDRKSIPKDLALSYRRDPHLYRELGGRHLRSKPLYHRDSRAEVLDSPFMVSLEPPVPPEGSGVLELQLDAAATMPVAMVDGTPVAVGEGTVFAVLPAGRHVIAVQGAATCSPVVADIEPGETATLVWYEEADRFTVSFGTRRVDPLPPASPLALYHWAIAVFAVCGLPLATVNLFSWGETASRATVVAVLVLGVALLPLLPWRKRERARLAALQLEQERGGQSRPVHFPWDGPQVDDRPALLGDRPERLPDFAPGQGALILRTKAHRHLWKDGEGVTARDAELAAQPVGPPTVRIDGLEQPASWGNWWYPLRPGPHTVEIEGMDRLERFDIDIAAGETTALRADAHRFVHRGPDRGLVHDEGALYLEAEEFSAAWMGDPERRLAYWR
ncbi:MULTISPECIES: hypothetical protein [Glycomyces]|uniref:Uncharacterized protein n=2 Tax=Glycomyces TaxID=58113 RepID=A0A9X3PFV0_9ACTN|nr:hypothetical protein [Glycomyces lechevalierae]MDA1384535.1 hypothetical protein [Glycomyces lechevalierae]MDR7338174.1 hypothetical protein [Glycomyces lechevalierae]